MKMADQPTQEMSTVTVGKEKPKTAKQLEKEAKKAAKLAKFAEKQAKVAENKPECQQNDKKTKKVEEKKVITYEVQTPLGDKKDIEVDLPAQYSPKYVEAAWYAWWKKQGFFKPEYGVSMIF
ncbi:valine--tRNA ligase-like [Homarus americanus]|uniref:valine--tRNA ligase-like n=1 Tax=Homarus americanus TaxID=6706 RepID=UPI001C461EC7|nr:valine--tRNA ligase-like [Homarus americanus]